MVGKSKLDRRGSGPLWFVIAGVVVCTRSTRSPWRSPRPTMRRPRQGVADLPARVGVPRRPRLRVTARAPTTGSSRSPTTSARPTSATRSPRAPSRRSTFLVDALGLEPGHAGARRRLRPGPPRPRPRPARASRCVGVDISQRFVDLATRRRARPARPSSGRRPRACAFDAEFDAAISLCQGAFGLTGGPGRAARRRRRGARRAWPGPLRPGGAAGGVGLLGLLPGALPRGPRHASTPTPA